jgi:hypothetical protein
VTHFLGISRRTVLALLAPALCAAALVACGHKPAVQAPPPPPVPPKDPWAWVPEDAMAMGQLRVAPFRETRIWQWLEEARKQRPEAQEALIEIERVDFAAFGLVAQSEDEVSGVGALEGAWGEGYLGIRAAQRGIAPERRGLLTFYRTGSGVFAQVTPNLVLVSSGDYVPWLEKRATEGDTVRGKATPVYQTLAPRIGLDGAHFAVIADDPRRVRGLDAHKQQAPMWIQKQLDFAKRLGGSVVLGPTTELALLVESSDDAHGAGLAAEAQQKIDALANDMFVRMFGFASLLRALRVERDGAFVSVRGSIPEAELATAVDKLLGMLDMAKAFRARGGAAEQPEPGAAP